MKRSDIWLRDRLIISAFTMPKTIKVQNIPDHLYERVKLAAQANGHSINSEVIACLELVLPQSPVSVTARLSRARELRKALPHGKFEPVQIDAFKRDGAH